MVGDFDSKNLVVNKEFSYVGDQCQDTISVPQKASSIPTTGIRSLSHLDFPQQSKMQSISSKLRYFFTSPRKIFLIRRTQSAPTQSPPLQPQQQLPPQKQQFPQQFNGRHLQVTKENIEALQKEQANQKTYNQLEDKNSSEETENENDNKNQQKYQKRVRFLLPEKEMSENEWDDVSFLNDSFDVEDQFQRILIKSETRGMGKTE